MSEPVPRRREFAVSYGYGSNRLATNGLSEKSNHFEDGDPVQPIEYRDGWIIPPE